MGEEKIVLRRGNMMAFDNILRIIRERRLEGLLNIESGAGFCPTLMMSNTNTWSKHIVWIKVDFLGLKPEWDGCFPWFYLDNQIDNKQLERFLHINTIREVRKDNVKIIDNIRQLVAFIDIGGKDSRQDEIEAATKWMDDFNNALHKKLGQDGDNFKRWAIALLRDGEDKTDEITKLRGHFDHIIVISPSNGDYVITSAEQQRLAIWCLAFIILGPAHSGDFYEYFNRDCPYLGAAGCIFRVPVKKMLLVHGMSEALKGFNDWLIRRPATTTTTTLSPNDNDILETDSLITEGEFEEASEEASIVELDDRLMDIIKKKGLCEAIVYLEGLKKTDDSSGDSSIITLRLDGLKSLEKRLGELSGLIPKKADDLFNEQENSLEIVLNLKPDDLLDCSNQEGIVRNNSALYEELLPYFFRFAQDGYNQLNQWETYLMEGLEGIAVDVIERCHVREDFCILEQEEFKRPDELWKRDVRLYIRSPFAKTYSSHKDRPVVATFLPVNDRYYLEQWEGQWKERIKDGLDPRVHLTIPSICGHFGILALYNLQEKRP